MYIDGCMRHPPPIPPTPTVGCIVRRLTDPSTPPKPIRAGARRGQPPLDAARLVAGGSRGAQVGGRGRAAHPAAVSAGLGFQCVNSLAWGDVCAYITGTHASGTQQAATYIQPPEPIKQTLDQHRLWLNHLPFLLLALLAPALVLPGTTLLGVNAST